MPEGHTLHRLARDHHAWFAEHPLRMSSPQGRFAEVAELDGQPLIAARAIGKHLLYEFKDAWIHVHLGLFGKFRVWRSAREPRPTVRLRIEAADRILDLTGPTDCSLWGDDQVEALRERLGPDPLDPEATLHDFVTSMRRRRKAIGAALLDQKAVAGVGNVYRAELLFLSRLDPRKPSRDLTDDQLERLWSDMRRLFPLGVRTNRIITTEAKDFGKSPSKLRRDERVWVYKQASCRVCGEAIEREELGARTLYWCPSCQTS